MLRNTLTYAVSHRYELSRDFSGVSLDWRPNRKCYICKAFHRYEFSYDSRALNVWQTFSRRLRTDKDVRQNEFFRDSLDVDSVRIASHRRCI